MLVTGAAGRIGSYFAEETSSDYALRLLVRGDERRIAQIEGLGEVISCDVAYLEGLSKACDGIDTVVHLAADPRTTAPWEDLLPNNVVGTYNVFAAAKAQGCRRVVFASSINAAGAWGRDAPVRSEEPINPSNLYGVSKCFGEALCRLYACREGLSAIAVRIGACETFESIQRPGQRIPKSVWVSHRDLTQLLVKCIEDRTIQFAIFQGLSNNRVSLYDISDARALLGYEPTDDAYGKDGE